MSTSLSCQDQSSLHKTLPRKESLALQGEPGLSRARLAALPYPPLSLLSHQEGLPPPRQERARSGALPQPPLHARAAVVRRDASTRSGTILEPLLQARGTVVARSAGAKSGALQQPLLQARAVVGAQERVRVGGQALERLERAAVEQVEGGPPDGVALGAAGADRRERAVRLRGRARGCNLVPALSRTPCIKSLLRVNCLTA